MDHGQFHFEVLKRLHSMKSEKNMLLNDDSESRPLVEARNLSRENSDMSDTSLCVNSCDELEFGSKDSIDWNDMSPENVMNKLQKALSRNQELEDALKIKESAIKKLLARNEELENELKRKESVRLSQLELLALRNVELEKELQKQSGRSASM